MKARLGEGNSRKNGAKGMDEDAPNSNHFKGRYERKKSPIHDFLNYSFKNLDRSVREMLEPPAYCSVNASRARPMPISMPYSRLSSVIEMNVSQTITNSAKKKTTRRKKKQEEGKKERRKTGEEGQGITRLTRQKNAARDRKVWTNQSAAQDASNSRANRS